MSARSTNSHGCRCDVTQRSKAYNTSRAHTEHAHQYLPRRPPPCPPPPPPCPPRPHLFPRPPLFSCTSPSPGPPPTNISSCDGSGPFCLPTTALADAELSCPPIPGMKSSLASIAPPLCCWMPPPYDAECGISSCPPPPQPGQPPPPMPKPGTIASSSSSWPEVSVTSGGFSPPPEKTEEASPGRSRHQNRVVWSLEALTRMCPKGWKVRAQTLESCAWESVARGPGCCDASLIDEEGSEEEERSQCKIAPSEPPETSRGWNGCQVMADDKTALSVRAQLVNSEVYVQQTSFLCPFSKCSSFIALMSKTRTVWSLDALAMRSPLGDHASAWTVFL